MFCYNAKLDGKVVSIEEKGIIIEYVDGTKKGIELGRTYGKAEGSVYPHDIVSFMKVNQKFKKGDTIAYNTGFFEQDILDPSRVIMKNSMVVKTVLYESNQTLEDSSVISRDISRKMSAKTTKMRNFVLDFNQGLRDVVKIGQKVSPNDILMVIEDEITSMTDVFDEQSLDTLKSLSKQAPRASYLGVVDRIEVYYNGDKTDMHPTIKALADRSDREIASICKAKGEPTVTGQVDDDYRVSGTPLTMDKVEIKFYITVTTEAGIGDKGVFSAQLKSVIGEVMDYSMTTEDGTKIDAVFGTRSVYNRIALSPYLNGMATTLLKLIAKKAVEIYKK
jgi:hypothetical protein